MLSRFGGSRVTGRWLQSLGDAAASDTPICRHFFGAVPVRFQSSDMHRLQLQFTWLTRVELISLSNKREWIVTSVGVSARTQCGDFEMEFRCGINGIIGPLASGWVKRSNLRWKSKVGTQRLSHSNSIRSSLADLIKLIIKSVIT